VKLSIKHYLLMVVYKPLSIFNFILKKIGRRPTARLRVLLYHDIAPHSEANFKSQLCWLSKSWQFVTPKEFSEILDGALPLERDSLLLTFDDGFLSNRGVAERILNPLKIKALFFIVSNFSKLSNGDNWRGFVAQYIDPGLRPQDVPDSKQNMSIDDLKFLSSTGHIIGAHTANHTRLSDTLSDGLNCEIIDSADYLEQTLGIKIEHFAYTFGDLASFTPEALAMGRRRFKYIHTGLRGNNLPTTLPWAIRRDSFSPTDPLHLLGALLEGGADTLYLSSLKDYESWSEKNQLK
jgi:peptidoglycan/xylan/chitin deacetylase (PgdA/CDA1 family)